MTKICGFREAPKPYSPEIPVKAGIQGGGRFAEVSLLRQRFLPTFPSANQFAALHHMRDGFERRDIVQRIDRDRD